MINKQLSIININRGFTLIELMVSMSIFMIVMIMALGALVNISNTAKKSRALHQAMDNVNFAMESMTRSLRTGSSYYCSDQSVVTLPQSTPADCSSGGSSIVFIPQDKSTMDTMYQLSGDNRLQKCTNTTNPPCVPITSSDVIVDNLKFYVKGTDISDTVQPSVYIIMSGHVSVGAKKENFSLQTFVSQRSSE